MIIKIRFDHAKKSVWLDSLRLFGSDHILPSFFFFVFCFGHSKRCRILFHTAEMLSFQIRQKAKIHNLFHDIYDCFSFKSHFSFPNSQKCCGFFISILGSTLIIVFFFFLHSVRSLIIYELQNF